MNVGYSARSHVGRVRGNNEDNLFVNGITIPADTRERPFAIDGNTSGPTVMAVCDGVGGEENGEIASFLATRELSYIHGGVQTEKPGGLDEIIGAYVNMADGAILNESFARGGRMGTTLALAVALDNGTYCFNIGDSRIYCLGDSLFRQITNDHTLAAEKENSYDPAIRASVKKGDEHKLTRCLGVGNAPVAEAYPPISGDCRILLCSDGLSDMVDAGIIERVLRTTAGTADAADALINLALDYGGVDNTTVIVADIILSK